MLWEATNYPKLLMKLSWFYVMHDQCQPFCAVELPDGGDDIAAYSQADSVSFYGSTDFASFLSAPPCATGDVAMGLEKSTIRIFDFSHHFRD